MRDEKARDLDPRGKTRGHRERILTNFGLDAALVFRCFVIACFHVS
jgi:hypothetical protein